MDLCCDARCYEEQKRHAAGENLRPGVRCAMVAMGFSCRAGDQTIDMEPWSDEANPDLTLATRRALCGDDGSRVGAVASQLLVGNATESLESHWAAFSKTVYALGKRKSRVVRRREVSAAVEVRDKETARQRRQRGEVSNGVDAASDGESDELERDLRKNQTKAVRRKRREKNQRRKRGGSATMRRDERIHRVPKHAQMTLAHCLHTLRAPSSSRSGSDDSTLWESDQTSYGSPSIGWLSSDDTGSVSDEFTRRNHHTANSTLPGSPMTPHATIKRGYADIDHCPEKNTAERDQHDIDSRAGAILRGFKSQQATNDLLSLGNRASSTASPRHHLAPVAINSALRSPNRPRPSACVSPSSPTEPCPQSPAKLSTTRARILSKFKTKRQRY